MTDGWRFYVEALPTRAGAPPPAPLQSPYSARALPFVVGVLRAQCPSRLHAAVTDPDCGCGFTSAEDAEALSEYLFAWQTAEAWLARQLGYELHVLDHTVIARVAVSGRQVPARQPGFVRHEKLQLWEIYSPAPMAASAARLERFYRVPVTVGDCRGLDWLQLFLPGHVFYPDPRLCGLCGEIHADTVGHVCGECRRWPRLGYYRDTFASYRRVGWASAVNTRDGMTARRVDYQA